MYSNKKVIVCGMARSGISAALLLASQGADVTLQDMKPLDALEKIHDLDELRKNGIKIYAGSYNRGLRLCCNESRSTL